MKKKFYLIESSKWSNDGSINPVVHAVVYSTVDSLTIKLTDFLRQHMEYIADKHCESMDPSNLVEAVIDSRLVNVIRRVSDFVSSDISFDCPEWQISYRIREVSVNDNQWRSLRILNNHRVVLSVEFGNCDSGEEYDFITENLSIRPEHRLPEGDAHKNPQYAEMKLTLNEFNVEGLEW